MTIRIEKALDNQTRYKDQKSVFLTPGFRRALAAEYQLDSVDIGIAARTSGATNGSTTDGAAEKAPQDTLWLPGYLKKTAFTKHLIIGAGFDQTGLTARLSHECFLSYMNTLAETVNTHDIQQLELRTQHAIPCQTDHADKVELSIELNTSCAERLPQFSKSTRRNLRLPFKHGFHYIIGKQRELLDDFYQLYLIQMRALGSLPHSKTFFLSLWQQCHENIEIFVGYMDKQPVAASFYFTNDDEFYGAWGCVHPDYKKHSVFLVMLWEILKHCEASGRKSYNLGRTSVGSNAYHFKKRLANQERKIHYYQLTTPQNTQKHRPVYTAASWLIRHSPPQVMHTLSRTLLHRFY